jgi:predicted outer membrane repeat protein
MPMHRSSHSRTAASAGRNRSTPRLEALEGRWLPSTVTNLDDTGPGSLRDAINQTPAGGTVDFQPGLAGTITLTTGTLKIFKNLTVTGPGPAMIAVSGNHHTEMFQIGPAAAVHLSGLTLREGRARYGGAINNQGTLTVEDAVLADNQSKAYGGAIWSEHGKTTLDRCHFAANKVLVAGGGGGAISVSDGGLAVFASTFVGNSAEQGGAINSRSSRLSVSDSVFSGNQAGIGGGIFSAFETASIRRTTVSANHAGFFEAGISGGGVYNLLGTMTIADSTVSRNDAGSDKYSGSGGGITNDRGWLGVTNCTIDGNAAVHGGPYASVGGGLLIGEGTATVRNTTVSDNYADQAGGLYSGYINAVGLQDTIVAGDHAATAPDVSAAVVSFGHNLIGDGTGASGFVSSDLVGTSNAPIDPKLGPLQDNGGPTKTLALLPGSPAIDAGDNTAAPPWDQRGPGYPRIVNGTIDIGAFEVQNNAGPANGHGALITALRPASASPSVPELVLVEAPNRRLVPTAASVAVPGATAKLAAPLSYAGHFPAAVPSPDADPLALGW